MMICLTSLGSLSFNLRISYLIVNFFWFLKFFSVHRILTWKIKKILQNQIFPDFSRTKQGAKKVVSSRRGTFFFFHQFSLFPIQFPRLCSVFGLASLGKKGIVLRILTLVGRITCLMCLYYKYVVPSLIMRIQSNCKLKNRQELKKKKQNWIR